MDDIQIITLTDEDGAEQDFEIIDVFSIQDKDYVALMAMDDTEGEVLILRAEDENGEESLVTIESDEEFDLAVEILTQRNPDIMGE